jgi:RNA-directed DNA polymerase
MRTRVPMPEGGADEPVVARNPVKAGGAKGLSQPALCGGQPVRKEPRHKAKPFLISCDQVKEAYRRVKANKGAAGVDGESLQEFEECLEGNLYKIWNRMSSGSYMPPPVKMVEIPKKDGRMRTLGIPTVGDRVAQMVVKMNLEPLVEPHFHEDSYGYRPRRSARKALAKARRRCWKYDWAVDLDIKGFFDTIDHDLMLKALGVYTQERWIHLYAARWLKAQAQAPDGELLERMCGTPQGGVISPLFANIYLHLVFDNWMREEYPSIPFERYADDIIVHCKSEKQAYFIKGRIEKRMASYKLALHPEKTQVVYCKDDDRPGGYPRTRFDFLGYTFQARQACRKDGSTFQGFLPGMSGKSALTMRKKMREWHLSRLVGLSVEEIAHRFNPVIYGWMGYYGSFYRSLLHRVFKYCNTLLMKWSLRKYKKLKGSRVKALRWWRGLQARQPYLFAHWKWYKLSTCI